MQTKQARLKLLVYLILALFIGDWLIAGWPQTGKLVLSVALQVAQVVFMIAISILQFVAIFWFLSRGRVYWINPGETGFGWKDYRGNPEIVRLASEVVTLLKGAQTFKGMGGEAIRGLLLCGPPGTGKSYLAQVIANEAGIPFAYASAPGFQNMFFGVGNLRVMAIYKKARKMATKYGACIIFIDEIDAIGASRGGGGGMMGMMGGGSGLLNELLLQMDPPNIDSSLLTRLLRSIGIRRPKAERPVVLTIAATNLPSVLDSALLRPGRFDRQIWVDVPDFNGRKDILQYYIDRVKSDSTLDVDRCSLDTIGYSPAQLKHVLNEGVILAHQRGADSVGYSDFRRAMELYEWGVRQPITSMKDSERRRIAYHEAGHAVAQYLLQPQNQVWKVTIVRHGSALGLAATKPREEQYHHSATDMEAMMQVCLASRAVEEIFLGEKLGGVTSDLQQATKLAAFYLGAVGMGDELYSHLASGNPMDGIKALRPKINKLLNQQMELVKVLVQDNAVFVHAIAGALLERSELTGDEVSDIYEKSTKQEELL